MKSYFTVSILWIVIKCNEYFVEKLMLEKIDFERR